MYFVLANLILCGISQFNLNLIANLILILGQICQIIDVVLANLIFCGISQFNLNLIANLILIRDRIFRLHIE